jgi:hypothetical protein
MNSDIKLKKIEKRPTPLELLQFQIDDLRLSLIQLKAGLENTQSNLKQCQDDLSLVNRPPNGYTTMYITKVNFDRVEDTALMKFFVRY